MECEYTKSSVDKPANSRNEKMLEVWTYKCRLLSHPSAYWTWGFHKVTDSDQRQTNAEERGAITS